jgi:hypothetical protein
MGHGFEARVAASAVAWILSMLIFIGAAFEARADARLSLPGWFSVAEPYSCPGAFALGPAGEVIVASNVVPVVWRVEPGTLAVSVHPLSLDADGDKDVGFTELVYSPRQGAYLAVDGTQRSLWRIERDLRHAHKIGALPSRGAACH